MLRRALTLSALFHCLLLMGWQEEDLWRSPNRGQAHLSASLVPEREKIGVDVGRRVVVTSNRHDTNATKGKDFRSRLKVAHAPGFFDITGNSVSTGGVHEGLRRESGQIFIPPTLEQTLLEYRVRLAHSAHEYINLSSIWGPSQLDVLLQLRLDNGRVSQVEIVKSSDRPDFDQQTLQQLKWASAQTGIPPELLDHSIEIEFKVSYVPPFQ